MKHKLSSQLALDNNNWILKSYGFQLSEKNEVLLNTSYKLNFNVNSGLSGNLDCNTFVITYESDDVNLKIQSVSATEIACTFATNQDYIAQHSFILNALTTAQTYSISELALTITATDSSQLIFANIEE